jgi:hypothetical protein
VSIARIESLIWVLVYGGLLGICLGFALQHGGQAFGWGLVGVGAAAVVSGVCLVWVRSRMGDSPDR